MLTISHLQARRLIRLGLDQSLPDAQWAALQAHLEECSECRAYQSRLNGLEKSLRRRLSHQWNPVSGPHKIPEQVAQARERRARISKMARQGVKYAAIGLAIFAVGWIFMFLNPPKTSSAPIAQPVMAVTRTPEASVPTFRGAVVYSESTADGAPHDLFMLTGAPKGVEKDQLTGAGKASEGDNIFPVWSPDGEWIAFLSNRDDPDGLRYDVYLISVAGTRLSRLTSDPNITYQGPLTWSGDGRWIAGVAISSGSPTLQSIALVPINLSTEGSSVTVSGSTIPAAQRVSGSLSAQAPHFSPVGDRLAYLQDNQIKVIDIDQNSIITAALESSQHKVIDPNFSWMQDGSEIVYQVNDLTTEIRAIASKQFTDIPQTNAFSNDLYPSGLLLTSESLGRNISSPFWIPGEEGILFARQDQSSNCSELWMIEIDPTGPRPSNPTWLQRFCTVSLNNQGMDEANWTPGGEWLVAAGQNPGEKGAGMGIYALRHPGIKDAGLPAKVEKLADVHNLYGQPRVRPYRKSLGINPITSAGTVSLVPPAQVDTTVLQRLSGQIAGITGSELITMVLGPDSNAPSGVTRLRYLPDNVPCIAIAPDGLRWAYAGTDTETAGQKGQSNVYVLSAVDGNPRAITSADLRVQPPATASWTYGCPVWSPDGQRIAVIAEAGSEQILQILDTGVPAAAKAANTPTPTSGKPARAATPAATATKAVPRAVTLALYPHTVSTLPRWMPDGSAVLFGTASNMLDQAGILRVDAASGVIGNMVTWDGYDSVDSLAIESDGARIAYIARSAPAQNNSSTRGASFILQVTSTRGQPQTKLDLPAYDPDMAIPGYGFLQWRAGKTPNLVYLFSDGPTAAEKTHVYRFPEDSGWTRVSSIASLADEVYAAAWSPDGNWLAYSTFTGTYAMNLTASQPGPVKISNWVFNSLDWK